MLDEPTNGLDVQSTRAVRRLIRQLREDGHCVLFSSHVMQEVSTLCDQIVIMAGGAIAAQGAPDELLQQTGHRNLEDAFVVLTGIDERVG
jgi:sodium transport system ATP-binding protein